MSRMPLRSRLKVELGMAIVSSVLLASTVAFPHWFESLFGFGPDSGDGSYEWALTGIFVLGTAIAPLAAAVDWRRSRRISPTSEG